MSPLSGNRPNRPFYIGIREKINSADIRHRVIDHLMHELDGILPPAGELQKRLLWAEIGVVLPNDMVWICIPNRVKEESSFKKTYEKAIEAVAGMKEIDRLKFSYNDLTLKLHGSSGEESWKADLIKSHYITIIKQNRSKCSIACDVSCKKAIKVPEDVLYKKICESLVQIVECSQADFCSWFDYVKNTFDLNGDVANTFFLILKPGSFFHGDTRSLQNNIIGSALFHWDKKPPSPQEILHLRRNLINTFGLELGSKLHLLKLSEAAAVMIPTLIEFAKQINPFNNQSGVEHKDANFKTRHKICEMLSKTKKEDGCITCIKVKPIADKIEQIAQGIVTERDFCGSLGEYKGMFERDIHKIFMDANGRNIFTVSENSLFSRMKSFLDLKIDILPTIDQIKLPYTPAWLFLVTIKLLFDRLGATRIKIITSQDNKLFMSLYFPKEENTSCDEGVSGLRNAIESGGKGDKSSAILDVLHGRLGIGALGEYMLGCYPDDKFIKNLCEGSKKALMEYTISCDPTTNEMEVSFGLDDIRTRSIPGLIRSVPRMVGFPSAEEVQISRKLRKPNTLFLSVGEACNLNCIYCYTDPKKLRPENVPLSREEQDKLLLDAKKLGVRYLVLPGPGEPLLVNDLKELVESAIAKDLYITIITNGTLITRETALYYRDLPVSFMVKLNSLNEHTQNELIGSPNGAKKIYDAISNLVEMGFTGFPETRLAIDALICQQAIDEIPDIVRFALERQIYPVIERLLPLGRGLRNRNILEVTDTRASQVLQDVQDIIGDREGNAFSGCVCDLHDYTLFVDVDGKVTKCVGGQREILLGDIRETSLAEIWEVQLAKLTQEAKTMEHHTSCDELAKCPGRSYCEKKYGITS